MRPICNRRRPEVLLPLTLSPVDPSIPRRGRVGRIAGRAVLLGLALMAFSLVGIDPASAATLDVRVATSSNDAEESSTGTISLTSSDLQLIHDTTDQTVGMRWTGLTIPVGSTITAAYIQFSSKESQSEVTSLIFQGQAADNPPTFGSTSGDISTRPRTTAATSWAPVAWTSAETSAKERTPDLSAVFQEVVSRPGWASGNALVMIVTGTGHRTAWSYDGKRSKAPLLHVEYRLPDFPPVASLVLTQLASPALTVKADASGSTDTDLTPIASYHFNFGDGSPLVTTTAPAATAQHTYAAAGTYTVTLTVTDTGNNTSSPVSATITITPPATPTIVERRTVTSTDDAEELADATMYLNSSDLELIHDATDQTVGMRWTGLTIPAGATITAAYIQFSAKEAQSEVTNLTFKGQAADNPPTFGSASGNISTRPRTTAATSWAPVAWTAGQAGANQRTPDLSPVFQEVVSRPGWASGNALVMIVTGTGHRTAWAYDGSAAASPLLHLEYVGGTPPDLPPTARLNVLQVPSPALTVSADASGSTDTDLTPIASYHFDFGDGTPLVTTTAPTATAQHTYAAAGFYTVTLTVTDTGNRTSAPASTTLAVTTNGGPLIAVYDGFYDTHHPVNPKPKPDPWRGSASVVFVGQQDNQPGDPPGGGWDTSTMRLDNLTTGSLTGVVVTVDVGTHHYALWGTNTIPAGYHLILAQTAFGNFDVPDNYPAGCYGCDTTLCTTMVSSDIPVVHVTIGGITTNYSDPGQILNTGGVDAAGCPYVGGPLPQTRYDESRAWVQIYPAGAAPFQAAQLDPGDPTSPAAVGAPRRTLWLAPPAPNPTRGELGVRFTTPQHGPVRVGLYDPAGRLVHRFVDYVLEAGDYRFQVDLADVGPGIYFLNLWTPQATRHEKLVLMR